MSDILGKFFASTSVFFKYFDKHPYVAYQNEEIKIPISTELKGIDNMVLEGKKDYMLKVIEDETQIMLSDVIDGGEF